MLSLALGLLMAGQPAEPPEGQPEGSDAIYQGDGRAKDDAGALDCYRARGDCEATGCWW